VKEEDLEGDKILDGSAQ